MATDCLTVYVTTATRDEALALGRSALAERLAACANVFDGVTSIYRWEGALTEEDEAVLLLKTRAELFDALSAHLLEHHTYDEPCIVAWPIVRASPGYLAWIANETRRP